MLVMPVEGARAGGDAVETLKEGVVDEPMVMQRRTLLYSGQVSLYLRRIRAGTGRLVW